MSATGKLSVTELEARYLSGGTKAIKDYYEGFPVLIVFPDVGGCNSITWTPHETGRIQKPETPSSGEYVLNACKVVPNLPVGAVITPIRGQTTTAKVVTVGRNDTCDVKFKHSSISRNHAVFTFTESGIFLEDLCSLNGTFVDGVSLEANQPALVTPYREIQFGDVRTMLLDWETLLDVCKP